MPSIVMMKPGHERRRKHSTGLDNRFPMFKAFVRERFPKAREGDMHDFFLFEVADIKARYGAASDDDIRQLAERFVKEYR